MTNTLKVGDTVIWRGCFGRELPKRAVVTGIEAVKPGEKYGDEVTSIAWGSEFIVTLANGHWARAHQVQPVR